MWAAQVCEATCHTRHKYPLKCNGYLCTLAGGMPAGVGVGDAGWAWVVGGLGVEGGAWRVC